MFRRRTAPAPRRGVILLVVLVLLTLFAVVGLTFVYHADAEARAARAYRDAQDEDRADVNPELLFSFFLGQLLYDVPDDERGVWSALRGHSLARTMYGFNDSPGAANDVPFNGAGRQRSGALAFAGLNRDDYELISYTYHPADGFLRDPERINWVGGRPARGTIGQPRGPYAGGFNAPYTYPDLNNVFLAAVKADGTVLTPSFHRPWLFGRLTDVPNFPPGNPGNPNWTSREGKYLTLRPRPIDMGPGFPYPEDEGGDVKNLAGTPGGNDSVWLDLDAPVLTASDGRKYKALFAPLIVDLDGRVNLNVAGNLRGPGGAAHASNMGWGPWEINPGRVLSTSPPEWPALLRGNRFGGRYGPHPFPHSPLPGNAAGFPGLPRHYAPVDYDGARELAGGVTTQPLPLPGTGLTPPFFCFPAPTAGYGNASLFERSGHPSLYHPIRPWAPDRLLSLAGQEALLRYHDTGFPALAAELARLCPISFTDASDPAGAARRRHLVTLHSFDPDRPGVTPWFWPADPSTYSRLPPLLPLTSPPPHPSGGPVPTPPGLIPDHPDSEFGPDGRAHRRLTALRRIDLNRYLPPYPAPGAASGVIADPVGFAVAQRARQYLAAEVFECLWRVTGAGDPALLPPPDADPGRWDALRWLAQLAVNIVDYVDADDYLTPFNWLPGTAHWVIGTELPRVAVNEAYVEYANVPGDPGLDLEEPRATRLKANVWVELYNPLRDDPPLSGAAALQVPGSTWGGSYRIVLARPNNDFRRPDNVRGQPARGDVLSVLSTFIPAPGAPPPLAGVDPRVLLPADLSLAGGYSGPPGGNKGFYVVGPLLNAPPETSPFPLPLETLRRPEMSYPAPLSTNLVKPAVLLQRLACPHRPPQPNPLQEDFNPYVTIDYLPGVGINHAWEVGAPGLPPSAEVPARRSWGRKQPYAAHVSQLKQQQPLPPHADQPQHTFFQHNADATTPGPNWHVPPANYPAFDWLVHLDRPLVNATELLHVSAFKPHELTQQFRTGDEDDQKFAHRAPWLDERLVGAEAPLSYRLYRALEFLSTHSRTFGPAFAGTASNTAVPPAPSLPPHPNQVVVPAAMSGTSATGGTWRIEVGSSLVIDRGRPSEEVVRVKAVGPTPNVPTWFVADFLRPHGTGFTITPATVSERVPGRINLNTVWDEEVFLALCDPNPSNQFNDALARTVFEQLKASRTVEGEAPGPRDRPFRSLAAGPTPPGDAQRPDGGLQDTLLRFPNPDDPERLPILAVPGRPHPYQTFELLRKVFANVTVRSNVFAVWVTVGFFEVTDDGARPVKLGGELGRSAGRHVRHRMFAIVDRSVLQMNPGPQRDFDPRAARSPGSAFGRVVPYLSIID